MDSTHGETGCPRSARVVFVGSVLLLALACAAVGAAAAADTAGPPTDDNHTVVRPDEVDRLPGTTDASYVHLASGVPAFDSDISRLQTLSVSGEAVDYTNCTVADIRTLGIDRGDDDPGTTVDVSLRDRLRNETVSFGAHEIQVRFPEDAPAVRLANEDQFVVRVSDCVRNPDEPGWYEFYAGAGGETADGGLSAASSGSGYVYVCDCADREAARSVLGTPTTPTPIPEDATVTYSGSPDAVAETTPVPRTPDAPLPAGSQPATPTTGGGGPVFGPRLDLPLPDPPMGVEIDLGPVTLLLGGAATVLVRRR